MDIFNQLGDTLRPHARLVSAGVSSPQALQIVTNSDLSFSAKPVSMTQSFREQLNTIAMGIDVNINSILNMLTVDQLAEVVKDHQHISFSNPNMRSKMVLNGITLKDGKWLFSFETKNIEFPCGEFEAHDLEIQDVLALMQTCENVLYLNSILSKQ